MSHNSTTVQIYIVFAQRREVCIAVVLQKMSRLFERWNDLWLSEELIAAIYFYSQSDNGPIYFHTERHFKVLVSCSDLKWHFHLGSIFMCFFGGSQGTNATLPINVPDDASCTFCNSWRWSNILKPVHVLKIGASNFLGGLSVRAKSLLHKNKTWRRAL